MFLSGPSWMVVSIIAPLAAGLFCFLLRRGSAVISLAAVSVNVLTAAVLVRQFLAGGPGLHEMGGWTAPLGIALRTDGPALIMLVMTAVTAVGISVYGWGYFSFRTGLSDDFDNVARQKRFFWPIWMLLLSALNGLYLSGDIFNLYITLELIAISAAALTALSGKNASHIAALRYLLVSLLGSVSYLLGVVFVYKTYGVLDLRILRSIAAPDPGLSAALALMSTGLLLKTALFPLHSWLPPAHANAPAPVSAILSGLVVKGSFYLMFRLWFDIFSPALPGAAYDLVGMLGAAAILWGATQALRQQHLKLLIAYSTVSQLGYLFIAFPLTLAESGGHVWSAVIFMAAGHACAKSAMFMAAGTIRLHTGHDRIRELAGVRAYLPITVLAYAAAGVNLMGLPPSGGFVAKWMMLMSSLSSSQWLSALVLMTGSLLAAAYVFRVVSQLFVIPPDTPAVKRRRRTPLLEWPALALAVISLLLGLIAPYPLQLLAIDSTPLQAVAMGVLP